jgi:pilus assembly protein CpaC
MCKLSTRTKKSFSGKLLLVLALVLALASALPFSAFADKGDLMVVKPGAVSTGEFRDDPDIRNSFLMKSHEPIYITLGKAELLDVSGDIGDVMVANSNIVDVTAIQSSRLYVVGLAVGDTNLIVLDQAGNEVGRYDIHVKYDLDAIQDLVNQLFPGEDIRVGSIHDQIFVTGTVATPEIAGKAANIVAQYVSDLQDVTGKVDELISNMLEVRGEQQVTLQVKVVEASRTIAKELGVETRANDADELSATTLFGNPPPVDIAPKDAAAMLRGGVGRALTGDSTGILSLLHDTGIAGIGMLNVVLEALEDENLVNILAEPNLTAVSGEQAGFLAGGEFPVPVGRDQNGNIVIQFRQFGVSLNFRPTVMSENRIALQMNTEVSSLDFDNAVELSDLTVPGLDVRKASTSVEIPSGGTLMIAGILQSKTIKGLASLPGIGKAPVIGKLMSSDSFQREETELLIFITPYLVEPYAQKDNAEQVKGEEVSAVHVETNPLALAFAQNMRRKFKVEDEAIFNNGEPYGYILE